MTRTMATPKKSSAQRAREFRAKHEENIKANIEAKRKWRLSMQVIRRMRARSHYHRFGNSPRPKTSAMPRTTLTIPGSRAVSDLDEPKVVEPQRLKEALPDPNVRTLGLGPLELEESKPVEPAAGVEYISDEIKIEKWPFNVTLWLLGHRPEEEPPP